MQIPQFRSARMGKAHSQVSEAWNVKKVYLTSAAAGIDPIELEEGLQIRSDLPFPSDKPIYFEVRVGIKDPQGYGIL